MVGCLTWPVVSALNATDESRLGATRQEQTRMSGVQDVFSNKQDRRPCRCHTMQLGLHPIFKQLLLRPRLCSWKWRHVLMHGWMYVHLSNHVYRSAFKATGELWCSKAEQSYLIISAADSLSLRCWTAEDIHSNLRHLHSNLNIKDGDSAAVLLLFS